MENSLIAWTDNTFNPWIGCTKVSPACAYCYPEPIAINRMGLPDSWGPKGMRYVTSEGNWKKPLQWNREAEREGKRLRVFCASMGDVFEDHPVPAAIRPYLWSVIRSTPWLDWQILTKRSHLIVAYLPADWGEGYPNVWLGTSVENQEWAGKRIPNLLRVPAVLRFLSVEPLLEPVSLEGYLGKGKVGWVIVGGESGSQHRPMEHSWARAIRDECKAAGVPFFFKQSSAYRTEMGIELVEEDGSKALAREFPATKRSRQAESETQGEGAQGRRNRE